MVDFLGKAASDVNQTLLKTVIESANDGILITNGELDSPNPVVIYANEAFSKISGYEISEIIGKSPRILQGENTDKETLKHLRSSLEKGEPFKTELLNYSKTGEEYWLDISIVPVKDEAGKITNFAAIERDITERKVAEEERKLATKKLKRANLKAEAASRDLQESLEAAEAANKSKSDFLANMSHELRTPMNGVIGMANLLVDTPLNEEQEELVSTINGSAETLLTLLNDILDFSKIEAGELKLEHIPYPPKNTINETLNLFKIMAQQKGIELKSAISDDIPDFIFGDSGRFRQIITNLLGNALKFTEIGSVKVSLIIEDNDIDILHCRVEDTGIGIPEDKIADIFQKFTQADASVTRKFGGTGLGLAITSQLVELMEGEIGVESEVGKGSVFWFKLPFKEAQREHTDKEKQAHFYCYESELINVGDAKLLLVEDYPVNQLFAKKLLTKFGFSNIDLAENGLEAFEKYKSNPYDLICMDCQMPEMDGYEATKEIRKYEEETGVHVPIIAMTANAMIGDREKCIASGMDEYISKPLKADRLIGILNHWFDFGEDEDNDNSTDVASEISKESLIDLEHFSMFTDDDPDEERELLEMFFSQTSDAIVILEESIENNDNEAWQASAHKLKGASGNLGAGTLAKICASAEKNSEANQEVKKQMLLEITSTLSALKKFLDER